MKFQNHLVIMVKEPRLGRVKTRLGKEIGAVAATRFYRIAAMSLLRRLSSDPRWQCWLQVTPDVNPALPKSWTKGCRVIGQGRGDLGQRMMKPMNELPPGPVVLIGSDIPSIRPHHIARAFALLGSKRVVFGPAEDGGFWLFGLRRRPTVQNPFKTVRWSTPHALADSRAGLDAALADTLSDVDDGAAYKNWISAGGYRR